MKNTYPPNSLQFLLIKYLTWPLIRDFPGSRLWTESLKQKVQNIYSKSLYKNEKEALPVKTLKCKSTSVPEKQNPHAKHSRDNLNDFQRKTEEETFGRYQRWTKGITHGV